MLKPKYSNYKIETILRIAPLLDEKDLETYLTQNTSTIEQGQTTITRQYPTTHGRIDLITKDNKGTICVIELKYNKPLDTIHKGTIMEEWLQNTIKQIKTYETDLNNHQTIFNQPPLHIRYLIINYLKHNNTLHIFEI